MRIKNNPQVANNHYSFDFYSSERRFISYYHQVKNVMKLVENKKDAKILIAGKGDGIVPTILKVYSDLYQSNFVIKTFDFAEDLHPDFLSDLVNLETIVNEKFDVILCCQTLEHLPLEEAFNVLEQMKKLSSNVIISIPYHTFTIRGTIKVPWLKEFEFCIKIPFRQHRSGMVDERHYWELGYSLTKDEFLRRLQKLGYNVLSSYTLKKDGFKHFIILESVVS